MALAIMVEVGEGERGSEKGSEGVMKKGKGRNKGKQ